MSGIWFDSENASIRNYSASVKGPRAVVKIELEVSDPYALGSLLESLGRAKDETDRERLATKASRERNTRAGEKRNAISMTNMLALTYSGGERS